MCGEHTLSAELRHEAARRFLPAILLLTAVLAQTTAFAGDPDWWEDRAVTDTEIQADYAPLLLSQLKWMATNACDEMEAKLPGGAGNEVWSIVRTFGGSSNYCPATVGQLKYVVEPVYDRLIAEGCTNSYPWTTASSTDDVDNAIANIGQLKSAFSFSLAFVNVSGDLNYAGMQTGTLWIVATVQSSSWSTDACTTIFAPGAYLITGVRSATNTWIKAWRDSNGDRTNDYWEACGEYSLNPVCSAVPVTGVSISMTDPASDLDIDDLPDWWEFYWWGNTNSVTGSDDPDGDGVANSNEYFYGASPISDDTDGDNVKDGMEILSRTDPNNSDTNVPTITIVSPDNNQVIGYLP